MRPNNCVTLLSMTGESSLHLAVVNNDMAMVRRLVACGASVNQRASGRFFLPEDQKLQRNGVTDYSGLFDCIIFVISQSNYLMRDDIRNSYMRTSYN